MRFVLWLRVFNFIHLVIFSLSVLMSQLNILIVFSIIKLMTSKLVIQLLKLFITWTMRWESYLLQLWSSGAFLVARGVSVRLLNWSMATLLPSCVSFSSSRMRSSILILIMWTEELLISSTFRRRRIVLVCHLTKLTSGTVLVPLLTLPRPLRPVCLLISWIRLQILPLGWLALIPATESLLTVCQITGFWIWIFCILFSVFVVLLGECHAETWWTLMFIILLNLIKSYALASCHWSTFKCLFLYLRVIACTDWIFISHYCDQLNILLLFIIYSICYIK